MLTWRELQEELEHLPEEVLDLPATAWLPHDVDLNVALDEFMPIENISAFDASQPISTSNEPSLSFGI